MRGYLMWDFHGTLVYPDTLWSINGYRAMREMFPDCGVSLADMRKYLDADGFPWQKYDRDYTMYTGSEKWWEHVGAAYLNTFVKCGIKKSDAEKIVPAIRDKVLDLSNYRLYPDATDVLGELKAAGFKHIMLSNHLPELEDICRRMGLMEYLELVISSGNIGYEKPRAEIYNYAINLLGRENIRCMIGDSEMADVRGAKGVGLCVLKISRTRESAADYVCRNLTEAKNLLLEKF